MRVATVESTTLATVGYDEARELLQLEFCSRAVYHYFGVPAAVYRSAAGRAFEGPVFQWDHSRTLSLSSDPGFRSGSQSAEVAARCDR